MQPQVLTYFHPYNPYFANLSLDSDRNFEFYQYFCRHANIITHKETHTPYRLHGSLPRSLNACNGLRPRLDRQQRLHPVGRSISRARNRITCIFS